MNEPTTLDRADATAAEPVAPSGQLEADQVDAGQQPDGLALLHDRMRSGVPVPIAELLDMRVESMERGKVSFAAKAEPRFANPMGGLHGGIPATMLDSVLGCAAMSVLPPGKLYTTLSLEVKYLRSVPLDGGELLAEGTVVHAGRTQITAEGRLVNADGKLVATATSTLLVLD